MRMTWVLLVLLVDVFTCQASSQTLPCQLAGGTSCPTMICPNTAVNYTCNVGSYAGNTVWNVPSVGVCSGTLTLAQAPPAPGLSCLTSSSSGTCGPFTVTNTPPLTSSVNCLTSTLSVVVTSAMNGLVVSCSSYSILSFTTTPVGNATISVVAPPSAPTLTVRDVSSRMIKVTWTVVPNATVYSVSINDSAYEPYMVQSNKPLEAVFELTDNTVYNISVVAMNCAGSSTPATIIKRTASQSFNINYPPMRTLLCPGDIITYTCTFGSSSSSVATRWTGSGFQCSTPGVAPNTIGLSQDQGAPLNTVPGTCGNLSAVMTNISGTCYTSVLTIPTPQYFNGTTVTCRDGNFGTLIGNDTLNIKLESPPSAPTNTSLISTNLGQLTVTWTSVPTATSYNVSINDSVNTLVPIPSTGAPRYTFKGLTSNTVYTVTVVAINCAGSSSPATRTGRTAPSNNDALIAVGIGVGVGVPVVLAVILVIVCVVYCTSKGGNTSSKSCNEESSPDAGSPDHKGPSKPPTAKQTSPSGGEAPKVM